MFDLGNIVITNEVKQALDENLLTNDKILKYLSLHIQNISESCEDDRNYNLEDIENKYGRVLNKYTVYDDKEIFISTYLDSINETTILFTYEY